jgi:prevent-host-death family protein
MCYKREMALTSDPPTVGARELRNETRSVLDRVIEGDTVIVTLDGRPVARIEPISTKPRWVNTEKFLKNLRQADPGLRDELREFDEYIDNNEFD